MKPNRSIWLAASGVSIAIAALVTVAVTQRSADETGSSVSHAEDSSGMRFSSRSDRQQVLRDILAEKNPQLRAERLRRWADGIEVDRIPSLVGSVHAEVRHALFTSWAERDLDDAMAWFGKHALAEEGWYREEMIPVLRALDPDKALAAMKDHLPMDAHAGWLSGYFKEWSLADPTTAAAKLLQLSENEKGNPRAWNDLLSQTAARWIESDPLAATEWLKSLPPGNAKSLAETQAAYRWTELNPAAASSYAASQNNPQLHQTVAAKWAESNPSAAIAWASQLATARPETQALAQASAIWAQTDPQAAATYAANLPESLNRQRVTGAIATAWAMSDPDALGKWMEKLPVSASRDTAVTTLCEALVPTDPGKSFQWAETISDESVRGDRLEQTASAWLKSDPAAAKDAIVRSSLPEETKRTLLNEPAP